MSKEIIPSPGGSNKFSRLISKIKAALGIVEESNTATHAIAAGKYVTWKGDLYKAKSAISSGATLSSSNLEAVSEGGLNALNEQIENDVIGFPDYANAINLNTQSFTASYNGILVVGLRCTENRMINISVNNTLISKTFAQTQGSGAYFGQWSPLVPVKKNDVVSIVFEQTGGEAGTIYEEQELFIPIR